MAPGAKSRVPSPNTHTHAIPAFLIQSGTGLHAAFANIRSGVMLTGGRIPTKRKDEGALPSRHLLPPGFRQPLTQDEVEPHGFHAGNSKLIRNVFYVFSRVAQRSEKGPDTAQFH